MKTKEEFDTETPGALIGKMILVVGSDEPSMVIGDQRLFFPAAEDPILVQHSRLDSFGYDWVGIDRITPWEEPKPKKLIAQYLAKDNEDGEYLIPDFLQAEEKAKLICDLNRWTLIKWPAPGFVPISIEEE